MRYADAFLSHGGGSVSHSETPRRSCAYQRPAFIDRKNSCIPAGTTLIVIFAFIAVGGGGGGEIKTLIELMDRRGNKVQLITFNDRQR